MGHLGRSTSVPNLVDPNIYTLKYNFRSFAELNIFREAVIMAESQNTLFQQNTTRFTKYNVISGEPAVAIPLTQHSMISQ